MLGELKPREWIINEYIPHKQVTMLSGAGGTGKTLLAQQLCTAIAANYRRTQPPISFLGQVTHGHGVLGYFCEDDLEELHRRQESINRALGVTYEELKNFHVKSMVGKDAAIMLFRENQGTLWAFLMAKMYPSQLPDRVLNDRKLKGEIKTYEALKALSDEFEIFYNRCPDSKRGSKAHKRRIDFIILHEKLGLLAIEVKGGKIRIGKDGGFEQYHPSKKDWAPTDPYRQIEVATISVVKSIREDGGNYWIPDDTCVIFPDTIRRDITDQPHSLSKNTLCADDLGLLPTQIPTFFTESKGKNAWSRDAFLDMRRRLQNMPEAPRGASSSGEATKTVASEAPKWKRKARVWSPKNPFVAAVRKPEPPKATPEIPGEEDVDIYEIDETAPRAPYLRQKPPEYPYSPPPEESASPWVARRHHLIRVMGIGTAAIATFIASVAGFLWLIRWVRG